MIKKTCLKSLALHFLFLQVFFLLFFVFTALFAGLRENPWKIKLLRRLWSLSQMSLLLLITKIFIKKKSIRIMFFSGLIFGNVPGENPCSGKIHCDKNSIKYTLPNGILICLRVRLSLLWRLPLAYFFLFDELFLNISLLCYSSSLSSRALRPWSGPWHAGVDHLAIVSYRGFLSTLSAPLCTSRLGRLTPVVFPSRRI